MAAKGNEQFLISINIDGKEYQVLGDCDLIEMLNSDDQRRKDQALALIRANCHIDECTESCGTKCNDDAESEPPDQKFWNKEDIKTLFDIRSKKENAFNSNKVHKSLWESVCKELSAVGVTATATQCMNKWKAMKREYKKTVDNNAQTGAEKKTCPFFEKFGELYGHKSGTQPTYTLSSRIQQNEKSRKESGAEEEAEDSNSSECCTPLKKPLKRKKNNQSAILALDEYTKRQEEYRKERLEVSKKQHEEKMNLMGKLIECLQPKQPKTDQ